jgi:hypothetical protein
MIELFNPLNPQLIDIRSCMNNFNSNDNTKRKKKKIVALDSNRGIPVISSMDDFKYIKFLRPTAPHWNDKINYNKNFSKSLKINFNISENEQKKYHYPDKLDIISWLKENGINTDNKQLPSLFNDGLLFFKLINNLETKEVIKPITVTRDSHKLINIKKVLEYLKSIPKFNKRFLYDYDQIAIGDSEIIIGLLEDIKDHYCPLRYKPIHKIKNKIPLSNISDDYILEAQPLSSRNLSTHIDDYPRVNVSLKNINKNIKAITSSKFLRATTPDLDKSISHIYSINNSYCSNDDIYSDADKIKQWLISIGINSIKVERINFKSGNTLKDFKDW